MIIDNLTVYTKPFYKLTEIDQRYRNNREKSIDKIIAKKLKAQENYLKNNCKRV